MDAEDPIASAGLRLPGPDYLPKVYDDARRIAQRLRHAECRIVGLQPVGARTAVLAPSLLIGRALAEQSGGEVSVVAPRVAWPAAPEHVLERDDEEPVFFAVRAPPSLALWVPKVSRGTTRVPKKLLPTSAARADVSFGDVEALLARCRERCAFTLLDLGAFRELVSLVEGVVLIGLGGRTTEPQLLRAQHELHAVRCLGVVLLEGK
jgi:hypothetical protein